jgi:mitochondrial import inner membrane translocase subunit TIM17
MATVPETSSTLPSLYHSPNGHRLAGGATAARMNAARVGGSFAVWGGLFCFFECGLVYVRRNEDPWNSILSGAAAGGLLSVRHVLFVSGNLALFGAALLVLIEGAGITLNRLPMYPPPEDILQFPGQEQDNVQPAPSFLGVPPAPSIDVQELPVPEPGPTGWFGGLFGMKKNDQVAGGDRKLETLELDLPSTPIPSFDYK